MTRILKRLKKIERNPNSVRFHELISIIESYGFTQTRSKGSHKIFEHPFWDGILTLQEVKGKAKPYQVKQAIKAIKEVINESK